MPQEEIIEVAAKRTNINTEEDEKKFSKYIKTRPIYNAYDHDYVIKNKD